jgi:hypothetical protein
VAYRAAIAAPEWSASALRIPLRSPASPRSTPFFTLSLNNLADNFTSRSSRK